MTRHDPTAPMCRRDRERARHRREILTVAERLFARKGYRFKGTATVLTDGPRFDEIRTFYEQRNPANRGQIRAIILVKVERALPLADGVELAGSEEWELALHHSDHFEVRAAALLGREAIPTEWVDGIELREEVDRIAQELV